MSPAAGLERRHEDRIGIADVLIVEDSPTTRLILRRTLEHGSYRVREAPDGRVALQACAQELPDVILLDVDMPVMDGPALLRELRADPALAEIPVVLLSARTRPDDAAAGLRLGALDYIRKPCAAIELHARVANVLERESERRGLRERAETADRLSLVDSLTGIANRRRLDRRRAELAASGSASEVGVVVIDVDHFKAVNDREGHLAGDAVLRILARRLQSALGSADLLVRWGGEEFLVLTPDRDRAATRELAERLCATVREAPYAIGDREPLRITASVGWAHGALGDLEQIIPLADEALYEAKRGGRDRVADMPRDQLASPSAADPPAGASVSSPRLPS